VLLRHIQSLQVYYHQDINYPRVFFRLIARQTPLPIMEQACCNLLDRERGYGIQWLGGRVLPVQSLRSLCWRVGSCEDPCRYRGYWWKYTPFQTMMSNAAFHIVRLHDKRMIFISWSFSHKTHEHLAFQKIVSHNPFCSSDEQMHPSMLRSPCLKGI